MGCDGYIINPDQEINVSITCYICGQEIGNSEHGGCRDSDGRVPVDVEIENYESR
jgi:hypothetical protein